MSDCEGTIGISGDVFGFMTTVFRMLLLLLLLLFVFGARGGLGGKFRAIDGGVSDWRRLWFLALSFIPFPITFAGREEGEEEGSDGTEKEQRRVCTMFVDSMCRWMALLLHHLSTFWIPSCCWTKATIFAVATIVGAPSV